MFCQLMLHSISKHNIHRQRVQPHISQMSPLASADSPKDIKGWCQSIKQASSGDTKLLNDAGPLPGDVKFSPGLWQSLHGALLHSRMVVESIESTWEDEPCSYSRYLPKKINLCVLMILEELGHVMNTARTLIHLVSGSVSRDKHASIIEVWKQARAVNTSLCGCILILRFAMTAGHIHLLEDVRDLLTQKSQPSGYFADLENLDQYATKVRFIRNYLQSQSFGSASPIATVEFLLEEEVANMRMCLREAMYLHRNCLDLIRMLASTCLGRVQSVAEEEIYSGNSSGGTGAPDENDDAFARFGSSHTAEGSHV